MFKLYKKIKEKYPQILIVGFVSFFTDIASEMLYPLTPIFLTTILGSSMMDVGLIEGIAEGLSSLLKTYSGFWSDKISKRRPFIFAGYLISTLSRPLIGLSISPLHVLGARSVDRLGKGLRTAPRDALIADIVKEQDRGLAFGWHRLMDTMGAVIGPLLLIFILTKISDLKKIYFWSIIPGAISLFFIFFIKEPQKLNRPTGQFKFHWKELCSPGNSNMMSTNGEFKYFILSWGLFCLTNSSDAFLLLKMKSTGLNFSTILFIYAFYNLIYALLSPTLGSLSDKWGKLNILFYGIIIFLFVYLGFSFATNLMHFFILYAIYGIYMAATEGVSKAYIADLAQPQYKAFAMGIFGTTTGLAQIFASIVTGLLWDKFGPTNALLFNCLGTILFLLLNFKKTRKRFNSNFN